MLPQHHPKTNPPPTPPQTRLLDPNSRSPPSFGAGRNIRLLHVAEKPSIASSIAKALSSTSKDFQSERGIMNTHTFTTTGLPFHPSPNASSCSHIVTSVAGHVFNVDFSDQFQSWESCSPDELFQAPTVKKPCKGSLLKHLQTCYKNCDYLVLWMDCDREGENINFEVLTVLGITSEPGWSRVYRAKFSAIAECDILKAYTALIKPDQLQALAVDARQELDLKVGCAFSRYQTRYFQGRYADLDSSVISYGPCQTPTLGFVVQRHVDIEMFKPEPYWVLECAIIKSGRISRALWKFGRSFSKHKVEEILKFCVNPVLDLNDPDQRLVSNTLQVANVTKREAKQGRPTPMNTVAFLKACSKNLGIGPHAALQTAERLYLAGYLSYPRTESSAYPKSFDIKYHLEMQQNHSSWGGYVRRLLAQGLNKGRGGFDAGDHPPITPCRAADGGLSGDQWRVYELVVRHFIATVSKDATWFKTHVDFQVENLEGDKGAFTLDGKELVDPGFLEILLHRQFGEKEDDADGLDDTEEKTLPEFVIGERITLTPPTSDGGNSSNGVQVVQSGVRSTIIMKEKITTPPGYLTESDLIGIMEREGIGTDASIPTHIENIMKRKYSTLETGRRVKPSKLGLVLAQGYHLIDSALVLPVARASIEKQCDDIAKGLADKEEVVVKSLKMFEKKFSNFVSNIAKMDVLFGSSFTELEDAGQAFTRCGHTRRYLQYISGPPTRLYNRFTETVYSLPPGGLVKQWSGKLCSVPDCNFELCKYAVGNPTRNFPLCPRCYNEPRDEWGQTEGVASDGEDIDGRKERQQTIAGRTVVLNCPLPDLHPTIEEITVCPDPESGGVFVVDVNSGNRWSFVSTRAPTTLLLAKEVKKVRVLNKKEEVTKCRFIEVEFKDNQSPLPNGELKHIGCLITDEILQGLIRKSFGSDRLKSSGRGGRGRGRGGRVGGRGGRGGRGKREPRDPKMSFSEF
ncbi:hypothetical protein TL16_g08102 [Triparma laevis f. inornata]|uniref:DNA topoisomerase n=1 Tax=Triparma laevis f. inornata TaxID=1714386 RepID=A0A9W7AWN1_9STRA|nr:hypothetical protein TL16_g08102 [Triparma laevis f. inornata]